MGYSIHYFNEAVQAQILALPKTLQARYISLSIRIQKNGPNLGEPHTKAIGQGMFELRLKGAEGIARVLYCTLINKQIVMLHCFIKKTQKIPVKEYKIAEKRLKEVKNAYS